MKGLLTAVAWVHATFFSRKVWRARLDFLHDTLELAATIEHVSSGRHAMTALDDLKRCPKCRSADIVHVLSWFQCGSCRNKFDVPWIASQDPNENPGKGKRDEGLAAIMRASLEDPSQKFIDLVRQAAPRIHAVADWLLEVDNDGQQGKDLQRLYLDMKAALNEHDGITDEENL